MNSNSTLLQNAFWMWSLWNKNEIVCLWVVKTKRLMTFSMIV